MLAVAVKRYHWFPSGVEAPMAMATCYHSPGSLSLSRFLSAPPCPRHRPLVFSLSFTLFLSPASLPPHDNAGQTFPLARQRERKATADRFHHSPLDYVFSLRLTVLYIQVIRFRREPPGLLHPPRYVSPSNSPFFPFFDEKFVETMLERSSASCTTRIPTNSYCSRSQRPLETLEKSLLSARVLLLLRHTRVASSNNHSIVRNRMCSRKSRETRFEEKRRKKGGRKKGKRPSSVL